MNCIDQVIASNYAAYHGDCVEVLKGLPDASVGYSIFSPPFASLYTYSNSPRDMGNVRNDAEFFEHFDYCIAELRRVVKPGRNVSFHCMDMPASKERDGYIGLKDFPGELLRAFQRHGFIFHSKATIWKDPVTAMTRTKALGLLHKSIRERSEMTRMGIPDYLITVRVPGEAEEHVTHTNEEFPVEVWQKVASPVWMDINQSDTLQYMSAREHDDERHICPLQLDVIRRGVMLWTNPGDIVLSPFMGIGSEGYVSLQMGRRFIGAELKESYFKQAAANLEAAVATTQDLFAA
jgi:DNA modification methylase